jgi:hypothetical protein
LLLPNRDREKLGKIGMRTGLADGSEAKRRPRRAA